MMTQEIYNQALTWKNEYVKKPYSLTMKQIQELDVMLVQLNKPKTRDRTCGVCVKQSIEILLHEITKYETNRIIEEKPVEEVSELNPENKGTTPTENTIEPTQEVIKEVPENKRRGRPKKN